jgi:hypothetical protein
MKIFIIPMSIYLSNYTKLKNKIYGRNSREKIGYHSEQGYLTKSTLTPNRTLCYEMKILANHGYEIGMCLSLIRGWKRIYKVNTI